VEVEEELVWGWWQGRRRRWRRWWRRWRRCAPYGDE